MALSFAFLVLEEHPYGREMLRLLLERGYRPQLLIEEISSLADEERRKFLRRIAGQPVPPTFEELLNGRQVPRRQVAHHNDTPCQALLREAGPQLVVLGGTRIIAPEVLEIPDWGTLNAHPGLLPRLRGSSSVAWALYKDLPIGCTTHLVDPGIDTGPILLQREMPVYRGDSYERIARRMLTLAGELMAETLARFEAAGPLLGTPQDPSAGEMLRVIPPVLLEEAKARLAEGRYSHFTSQEGDEEEKRHGTAAL